MAARGGDWRSWILLPGGRRNIGQPLAMPEHRAMGIGSLVAPWAQVVQRKICYFGDFFNIQCVEQFDTGTEFEKSADHATVKGW